MLAFNLLSGLLRPLLVNSDLGLGLIEITSGTIRLRQSIMRLLQVRPVCDRVLEVRNRDGRIFLVGVHYAELQERFGELRIQANRVFQQRLDLNSNLSRRRWLIIFPYRDSVQIIRLRVISLQIQKTLQTLDHFVGNSFFAALNLAQKKIGKWILGIQIGRFAEPLHRLFIRAGGEFGGAQSDQHSSGVRE